MRPGTPIIPGSSLKGALKQHCYFMSECVERCRAAPSEKEKCFNEYSGRVDTESPVKRLRESSSDEESFKEG